MVDCPEFTEIPQLRFQIGRWDYRDWIRERIDPWMQERTVAEIVELGQLFRLPLAPLGNGATIPDMDHLRARGVYIDNPAGFRQPRAPWLMSVAEQAPVREAPRSAMPTASLVWAPRESVALGDGPAGRRSPVCGWSTSPRSGPGPPRRTRWRRSARTSSRSSRSSGPDGIRYSGGMRTDVDDWWEYGWVFHAMNTNKRSVTLDLQSEDGLRLVKELVQAGRRGRRELLAAGDGAVRPRRRRAARAQPEGSSMVRMPAFGLDGPWRDRVGFAPTMEQIAGLAWVTGLPDGPARRAARRMRSAGRGACRVRDARGAGVRRSHGPRPARRGSDDRDRAQRDRCSDNGIRGFRVGDDAPRQPRASGGTAGHLPMHRR